MTKIEGAPFQVGDRVWVVDVCDETGNESNIGHRGVVRQLDYDSGVGQVFPTDPMLSVELWDGRRDAFWPEELAPAGLHRPPLPGGPRDRAANTGAQAPQPAEKQE